MAVNVARGRKRGEAQERARRDPQKGFGKWRVRRQRNGKRIERGSERGHTVQRKLGPKQLGRENILGALSKSQEL